MARYECTQCGQIGETTTCLNCGSAESSQFDDGEPLVATRPKPSAKLREERSVPPRLPAAVVASRPEPSVNPEEAGTSQRKDTPWPENEARPQTPRRQPTARRRDETPALAIADSPAKTSSIGHLGEFEQLLQEGVKAVILCGGSKAGKSEIAHGYMRAAKEFRGRMTTMTLGMEAGRRYDMALGGTEPGTVWYQLIDRRRAFLDPSGEFFAKFSDAYRDSMKLGDITEEHFDFVRTAVRKLAGIVLVFDLTNSPDHSLDDPWEEQENVLAFTLGVLRWLRFDKKVRFKKLGLRDRMALFLADSGKKLDVPVLVLFSKADQVGRLDLTTSAPLAFARTRLTTLHAALFTHARRYRFDYVHTMVQKDEEHALPLKYPCGVLLPMEWLLGGGAFRWMSSLPTAWLGGGK